MLFKTFFRSVVSMQPIELSNTKSAHILLLRKVKIIDHCGPAGPNSNLWFTSRRCSKGGETTPPNCVDFPNWCRVGLSFTIGGCVAILLEWHWNSHAVPYDKRIWQWSIYGEFGTSQEQHFIVPIILHHWTEEIAEDEMPVGYAALYNHLHCMRVIFQMKQHLHKKWGVIGVSARMADGYQRVDFGTLSHP